MVRCGTSYPKAATPPSPAGQHDPSRPSVVEHKRQRWGWVFVAPFGLVFLGFMIVPLAYAFWTAFHPPEVATRFALGAPLTLDNFRKA